MTELLVAYTAAVVLVVALVSGCSERPLVCDAACRRATSATDCEDVRAVREIINEYDRVREASARRLSVSHALFCDEEKGG